MGKKDILVEAVESLELKEINYSKERMLGKKETENNIKESIREKED